MITVSYSKTDDTWYHQEAHSSYVWGSQNIELPVKLEPTEASVRLRTRGNKAGPIIGIVTSSAVLNSLNQKQHLYFKEIHRALQTTGGILVLFSPEQFYERYVYGVYFEEISGEWRQATLPLPDFIYNRFPNRYTEREKLKELMSQSEHLHIPFFNTSFFSKWETYELLSKNTVTQKHLPDTRLLLSLEDVRIMLKKHQKVYLKPIHGSKGRGIFTLTTLQDGSIHYESSRQKKIYSSLEHVPLPTRSYIVQETIETDTLQDMRYDLRILANRFKKRYIISGIGVRQSERQSVTTHTLNGGILRSIEELPFDIDTSFLTSLIDACGQQLHQHFQFVGEFSLDIGRTKTGDYYIFEINAKPMIFDEPHIRSIGIKHLIRLFYKLTNF